MTAAKGVAASERKAEKVIAMSPAATEIARLATECAVSTPVSSPPAKVGVSQDAAVLENEWTTAVAILLLVKVTTGVVSDPLCSFHHAPTFIDPTSTPAVTKVGVTRPRGVHPAVAVTEPSESCLPPVSRIIMSPVTVPAGIAG
jgi:hypothetical protein